MNNSISKSLKKSLYISNLSKDIFIYEDIFFSKKNKLLLLLEEILDTCENYSFGIFNDLKKKLIEFIDELNTYDNLLRNSIDEIYKLNNSNTSTIEFITHSLQNHKSWKDNIEKFIFIIDNDISNIKNRIPSTNSIYRMKYHSNGVNNDFPYIYCYKTYIINNNLSITLLPKNSVNFEIKLDLFDILILRTIFVFYINGIFRLSYICINKYIASNNKKIVTDNQISLLKKTIKKLENIDILVSDNISNKTHKERLIYMLEIDNESFLILKKSYIYDFLKENNLYIKLDNNISMCPISITKNNIILREYLINKIIINNKIKIYFEEIYIHLGITSIQQKKKNREIIIRILDYWKKFGYIDDYSINFNYDNYPYIKIKKI